MKYFKSCPGAIFSHLLIGPLILKITRTELKVSLKTQLALRREDPYTESQTKVYMTNLHLSNLILLGAVSEVVLEGT